MVLVVAIISASCTAATDQEAWCDQILMTADTRSDQDGVADASYEDMTALRSAVAERQIEQFARFVSLLADGSDFLTPSVNEAARRLQDLTPDDLGDGISENAIQDFWLVADAFERVCS